MISSHVKISMISLITSLSLKFVGVSANHLQVLLESLWQSLEILGNSPKTFGNVRLAFGTILENLQKVVRNLWKIKTPSSLCLCNKNIAR